MIRLIAALQVLLGHTIAHLNIQIPRIVKNIINFPSGVPIFFAMSGYLIWLSVGKSDSFKSYAKKRFLRIYPELWLAVALEVIVIVILYRYSNLKELLVFTFGQATIFQFWTPASLREYGCGTPNGALWTICVIIQFYFVVWFLYKLMHTRKMYVWILVWIMAVSTSMLGNFVLNWCTPEIILKLYNQTIVRYLWLFLIGCFLAEFKDKILDSIKKFWWAFLALSAVACITSFDINAGYSVIRCVTLVIGVLGFSYSYSKFGIRRDISYGIYLYHMTVINALITFGVMGEIWHIGIVMALSCALAWASTEISKKVINTMSLRNYK